MHAAYVCFCAESTGFVKFVLPIEQPSQDISGQVCVSFTVFSLLRWEAVWMSMYQKEEVSWISIQVGLLIPSSWCVVGGCLLSLNWRGLVRILLFFWLDISEHQLDFMWITCKILLWIYLSALLCHGSGSRNWATESARKTISTYQYHV